jgi:hypothetical protein
MSHSNSRSNLFRFRNRRISDYRINRNNWQQAQSVFLSQYFVANPIVSGPVTTEALLYLSSFYYQDRGFTDDGTGNPVAPEGYSVVLTTDQWRGSDPNYQESGALAEAYDGYILQNNNTGEVIFISVGSEGSKIFGPDWWYNYSTAWTNGGGQMQEAMLFFDFFLKNIPAGTEPITGIASVGNSLGASLAEGIVAYARAMLLSRIFRALRRL